MLKLTKSHYVTIIELVINGNRKVTLQQYQDNIINAYKDVIDVINNLTPEQLESGFAVHDYQEIESDDCMYLGLVNQNIDFQIYSYSLKEFCKSTIKYLENDVRTEGDHECVSKEVIFQLIEFLKSQY